MPIRKTGSSGEPPDKPSDRPSGDDLELWRHVTRGTRPLTKRPNSPKRETPVPPGRTPVPPPPAKSEPAAKKKMTTPAAQPPPRVPDLEKGAVVGVDKRTVGRLRRGKLPVEGRLDLHGLSQSEAERALSTFLARSQARGHRCVLVITGKGGGGGGRRGDDFERTGVLRRMVPLWLNAAANRPRVLAFDEARAQHGGGGALYVLLKRPRAD